MTAKVDIDVHEGQPWRIYFVAHEADGTTIMPLDGAEVEFRVSDDEGAAFTQRVGDGVTITDATAGEARIDITVEEQEHALITAAKAYNYEIRVTTQSSISPQAEGQLNVHRSLFAADAAIDPLVSEFRTRFPEFTEDDDIVSLYLHDADLVMGPDWSEDLVPKAKMLLAAHFIQMGRLAKIEYESGGAGTGAVRVIRTEGEMVGFDTKGGLGSKSGYMATYYGQQYLALRSSSVRWVMRA